ncbi:LuxR family transcriptional regulator [Sphingomonas sp. AR_OL41]|nr:LuxR family transcriptional regulator [Sphingomonas sp. AR_OL41]
MAIADAFVDRACVASSEDELFELLSDCCSAVGIRFFALVHHVNFGLEKAPAIRIHNYPPAWQRWFDENQLGRADPVHRASQLICCGFPWSVVPNFIELTAIDRSVFAQARGVGIGDGYTIPTNVPGEFTGSCSFAMATGETFTRELQAVAQIIGGIAFQAARRITRIREVWPPIERPLTDRQRDCVLWSTRGKTDWETGKILGISKGTVIQHLANARERYDVHNKAELSVRALHDGVIAFSQLGPRHQP